MKRLLLLCIFLLFLPGCSGVQLNERAIVQAAAIDLTETGCRLTLQIFDPEGASKEAATGGKILSAEGKTVAQAVREASLKSGQEIFFGHTKLLILGESVAEKGVKEAIGFFNGQTRSRPNIDVLLAAGQGASLLQKPLDQSILPVLTTRMLLEDYRDNGRLVRTLLKGLASSLENPAAGAYLPVASYSGQEETPIQVVGTALLSQGRLQGAMTPDETRGLLWVLGEMGKTQLEVQQGTEFALFQVEKSDVKVKTRIENDLPKLEITVSAQVSIEEESPSAKEKDLAQRIADYETRLQWQIETQVRQALDQLILETGCDAAGFSARFRQRHPDWWKKNGENWPALFPETDCSVTVKCRINRGGNASG